MTSPTTASDAVHARATRKAFVRLVPLLMAAYFMAFVDRTNVGLAKSSLEVDAGIDAAADVGITCVIQPGGSIRDEEVIAAADEHGIAMIFTDMRHFRH